MSDRSKESYISVFRAIRDILPSTCVASFMLDYEKATWAAIKEVFPDVLIKGCLFHYSQVCNLYGQNKYFHLNN